MFLLLLLAIAGFVIWTLVAPGLQFLPAFARLLTGPRLQQTAREFLTGRSYVTGHYANREVACRLQLKRRRYGQGHLVIAVRTAGPAVLNYDGIESRTKDDHARHALFTLAKHDLLLAVEEGWLTARWQPQGFVIFPGRFSEEKWHQVLDAMTSVATSLEEPA